MDLETRTTVPLAEAVTDVKIATVDGEPEIFLSGPSGVSVLSSDGTALASVSTPTRSLLLRDPDGDGVPDLILCGDSGVGLSTGASTYADLSWVSTDPCEAVSPQTLDGGDGVAAADETAVTLLWDDGTGGLGSASDAGLALDGPPLLAAADDALAATSQGDTALVVRDHWGVSSLAAGGGVTGLTATADWVASLGDAGLVRFWESGSVSVASDPGALAVGDLLGDGEPEILVLHPNASLLGVLDAEGVETTWGIPAGATHIATGDLDGDGCDDVVIASDGDSGAALTVMANPDCVADPDGDGFTVADGDCDEGNPDIHPGAEEICDGLDNDCDGWTDGITSLEILGDQEFNEGDTALLYADVGGCSDGVVLTWSTEGDDIADCSPADPDDYCDLLDDGSVTVRLNAAAADGSGSLNASLDLTVDNVDPQLVIYDDPGGDDFSDHGLTLTQGDTYTAQWAFSDVPADTVSMSVTVAPDGFQLSPSGAVVINADAAGTYPIRIKLDDEDGGESVTSLTLEVLPLNQDTDTGTDQAPTDCTACNDDSGGCCGASNAAFFGLFFFAIRRRRQS